MSQNFKMVATTIYKMEEILATELSNLGAQKVKVGIRNVEFYGDKGFMYKANLALRTAIRILKPIKNFTFFSEEDLYKKLKQFEWDEYMGVRDTFSINAVVNSDLLTSNSHYIALKSKDALVDYFRDKYHKRPDVEIKHPTLKIHIHIRNNNCTISLDSSGESLHKRGYRSATNIAPINEVLAAGLVLLSGYNGNSHFIDPMCGSGTILIEAAMIANNIPANINRREFNFEQWSDFDEDLFYVIHDVLIKKITSTSFKISGLDKAPSAIRKATENIKNANLEEFITVKKANFFESKKEIEEPTTILFNPPYGERLQIDALDFYKKIGDTLKQGYANSTVWFITSDIEALKYVGLRTSKRLEIQNSKLECRFVRYDMYKGSKKIKKQPPVE